MGVGSHRVLDLRDKARSQSVEPFGRLARHSAEGVDHLLAAWGVVQQTQHYLRQLVRRADLNSTTQR